MINYLDTGLFAKIIPYECEGLTKIRIGNNSDGGYVIPKEILDTTNIYLTFGVNDEDSFEMDIYNRTKSNNIILCDPFVAYTRDNSPLTFHSVGLAGKSEGNMRSLSDFLTEFNYRDKGHILLKVDIEKGEYDAFKDITQANFEYVDCFILEIHGLLEKDLIPAARKLLDNLNESFVLFHVHANNNGAYFIHNDKLYPDVLECTYISKKYLEVNKILYKPFEKSLPDAVVDRPNIHVRGDYLIKWWL